MQWFKQADKIKIHFGSVEELLKKKVKKYDLF